LNQLHKTVIEHGAFPDAVGWGSELLEVVMGEVLPDAAGGAAGLAAAG